MNIGWNNASLKRYVVSAEHILYLKLNIGSRPQLVLRVMKEHKEHKEHFAGGLYQRDE
jgi:hypothetical protein